MEVEGKIIQIIEPQIGTSAKGQWKKQDFIVETNEQFPKKVCIGVFNDKIPLSSFNIGSQVKVHINLESREFNGKWYTNINGWKIELLGDSAAASVSGSTGTSQTVPPPTIDNDWSKSEETDSLPF
ncbi:MAG: DUF3127 domain-containing protein [Bacteroidales bacterium]|nr:DUF3127 domain-containing protein [Bacteroidales bacterium]